MVGFFYTYGCIIQKKWQLGKVTQNKSQKEQGHTKSERPEWSHDEKISNKAGVHRLEQEKVH